MSKKSFIIILVLSVVVNEVVLFIDALIRDSLVAGEGGLPLRFTSSAFFSSASTNYLNLILDIIFWFIVIFIIWKGLSRLIKR